MKHTPYRKAFFRKNIQIQHDAESNVTNHNNALAFPFARKPRKKPVHAQITEKLPLSGATICVAIPIHGGLIMRFYNVVRGDPHEKKERELTAD
jgi:hypothetical protein